ncbi:MAG TPA: antibiotic biosynthesis monooxygenase [Arenibacter sp.]|nr:antibiotic biosynthesis monooxygenase [Arenibacter sp.]
MLVRIVKLTLKEEHIADFKALFKNHKKKIAQVEGCNFLELLQDIKEERVFFTHSHWNSEVELENYRRSAYFGNVWKAAKALFADRAEAWSLHKSETFNEAT